MQRFKLNNDTIDFHFVAPQQPGVFAVTVGACLAELDRFIFLVAVAAKGNRRDGVDFHLTAPKDVFFVGSPAPTISEQMRHHGRHLADVHHHAGDMLHMVFFGHLLDVLDDIEYDS